MHSDEYSAVACDDLMMFFTSESEIGPETYVALHKGNRAESYRDVLLIDSNPEVVLPEAMPREEAVPPFDVVFRTHLDRVFRTLRHLRVRESDVPDVAQEVFVTIHRLLPAYEPRAKFTTWVYAICVNAARQHARRAHVRREMPTDNLPEDVADAGQDEHLDRLRAQAKLARVLAALDEDKRAVFVLYEIESLDMQEIALALDVPLQTAYSRLHAARKVVAKAFGEWRKTSGE